MANDLQDTNKLINIEIEEAVLGAIILDPGAIAKLDGHLELESFSAKANQAIYQSALDLHSPY